MPAEYLTTINLDSIAEQLRAALSGKTWTETRMRQGERPHVSSHLSLVAVTISAAGVLYLEDSDGVLPLRPGRHASVEFGPSSCTIRFVADDGVPISYVLEPAP